MNQEETIQKELSPQEIWQKEINGHTAMKKKYTDYPKLPKALLRNSAAELDGHLKSCLRGFYKRVTNWEISYEVRMHNNI
jgi:hypothetical protein